jgi:hypothetical protein
MPRWHARRNMCPSRLDRKQSFRDVRARVCNPAPSDPISLRPAEMRSDGRRSPGARTSRGLPKDQRPVPLFDASGAGELEECRPLVATRLMRRAKLARKAVVGMVAQVNRCVARKVDPFVVTTGETACRCAPLGRAVSVGALGEPRGQEVGHRQPEMVCPGATEHGMPCGVTRKRAGRSLTAWGL